MNQMTAQTQVRTAMDEARRERAEAFATLMRRVFHPRSAV